MLELELLQVALGNRDRLSRTPSEEEWDQIRTFAKEQTIIGVLFTAFEKLPKDQRPPIQKSVFWVKPVDRIKQNNIAANNAINKMMDQVPKDCHFVVLKGQSVASYYPDPSLRTTGDIDVWLVKKGMTLEESRKVMAEETFKLLPTAGIQPHHMDYLDINNIHAEIHFTPSNVFCLWRDKRVQRYFEENLSRCEHHQLPIDVDIIFQLIHIRRHILQGGIGLRQVCDLYYTIQQLKEPIPEHLLRHLGLWSFAKAMMWVLQEMLGMKEEELICPPNERSGKFIQSQILEGGNFGHYNIKNTQLGQTKLAHQWKLMMISFRSLLYFPEEALAAPFGRFYLKWWLWKNGY